MKHSILHLHSKFTVAPVDPRVFGGFLEHIGRAVYEGVYDPASVHADETGCRKDLLEALRELRFTAMRYPGGNFVSGYHWLDAVGPKESRPNVRDLAWQSIETNHFGPNEFLDLSKRMGWTPMLAVNLGTGTPEEARNWLEYCNVESGGKWADLRVEHGYKEPFGVKLWCLGNEMDGPWQIGHVPAEMYAINAQQTANMMSMCDPSVELVVCGSCTTDLPTYLQWDRTVLAHCREYVDYISVHRYVGNTADDTEDFLAVGNSIDKQIEATAAVCEEVRHTLKLRKRIGISFDEWNVWYRANKAEHMDGRGKVAPHLVEEVYNHEDSLVIAGFLNSFIRHADSVKIANLAQIVNVIAPLLTDGDRMVKQTIYYPIVMIAKRREGVSLQTQVEGPSYTSKTFGKATFLDTSAILNGDKLTVFAVNRSTDEPMDLEVRVADRSIARLLDGEIVCANDPKAANTFEEPDKVVCRPFDEVRIGTGVATIQLPPLSVVAATFQL